MPNNDINNVDESYNRNRVVVIVGFHPTDSWIVQGSWQELDEKSKGSG